MDKQKDETKARDASAVNAMVTHTLTEHDQKALDQMPDEWFDKYDTRIVFIRRLDYRIQRLLDKGFLEMRLKDGKTPGNLGMRPWWEYKKCV